MTITRTFGTKFVPSYVAGTILEIIHFRDMTFDADERVAIYLDTANASMDLGSFNIAQFPQFEGDESDTEKVLLLNKSEASSNKIGLKILKRKNNTGNWNEVAEIILVNRGRKDYLDLRSYTGYPTRIMEKNDAIAIQLVDYGDGLLWDKDFISIDFGCTIEVSKKNDLTELTNRLAALENLLNLFGPATPTAGGTNGLVKGASVGEQNYLLRGDRTWQNPAVFAKQTDIDTAIFNLIGGAPGALNTLDELAAALADDANFAATITALINSKAPLSSPNFTGFTTLGDNVAIKTKLITGITSATQGGNTPVAHGLNSTKIVGLSIVVHFSLGQGCSTIYTPTAGYSYSWYYDSTNILVINNTNNSINILSKPFTALFSYIA